ncbi:hypothetical protein G6F62_015340 [Rhizopus arrhizus]|nr:hypothetical protein G6F35_017669 [Rhizopus arrhizus]KAG1306806.1 hypothetical protein G6F62_015340 [Rhizopus arrhizus]
MTTAATASSAGRPVARVPCSHRHGPNVRPGPCEAQAPAAGRVRRRRHHSAATACAAAAAVPAPGHPGSAAHRGARSSAHGAGRCRWPAAHCLPATA